MFLPTGDTPNPRNFTPWVNYLLIAANVAVFLFVTLPLSAQGVSADDPLLRAYLEVIAPRLPRGISMRQVLAQITQYDLFVFANGYKPGAPSWSNLFSSLFLHGSFLHLAGNMLFLWIYGDNVEHRLGRLGYLICYLLCGVGATLFFAIFARGSMTPLIGASGAISGVLGFYFLLFPRNQVKVFVFIFPFIMDHFLLPARWVLGLYLIVDNLLPFIVVGTGSGVAHGAHIGGFFAGLALAYAGERLGWRSPWAERRGPRRVAPRDMEPPDPLPLLLRRAIRGGDAGAALELAAEARAGDLATLSASDCVTLAGWLEQAGYSGAASRVLRGCIGRGRGGTDLAQAYLQLGLMRLRQGQEASAYHHLLEALEHDPDADTEAHARAALSQINLFRRR